MTFLTFIELFNRALIRLKCSMCVVHLVTILCGAFGGPRIIMMAWSHAKRWNLVQSDVYK